MADLLFGPVPADDAIDFIQSKPVVSRAVFDGLLPGLRARAFCVTGIEDVNVLQRVRDKIAELPAGARWDDVKKDIAGQISPYLVDDDADPEERDKQLVAANRRAELLLRTHGFQAYQAAAYDVADRQRDTHPYWQYMTMEDDAVRPSHAALDGVILPADSTFWRDHYPPWDWGCRCQVVPISEDDRDDAKKLDAKRPADEHLVLEGAAARELEQNGRLVRGPNQIVNCASPVAMGKENAFQWHPGDLRLPVAQLQARYAPDIWGAFELWAKGTRLDPQVPVGGVASADSIWSWLMGKPSTPPVAPPVPAAPVRHSPVSAALSVKMSKQSGLQGKVEAAVRLIDAAHDDGTLPPIRVTQEVSKSSSLGEYRSPLYGPTAWGKRGPGIGVNKAGQRPELTVCHEVGHALDELVLMASPSGGVFASEVSPELAEWRQAVSASAAAGACRTSLAAGGTTARYYRYLLTGREQFARSYAQYIATKTGDATMLAHVAANRPGMEQWTAADFQPILQAFDKLFAARGWI